MKNQLILNRIYNCDCLDGMREMPENSIDAIVTDPPYGLEFMGAEWDCLDGTTSGGMMNNGGLIPAPRYGKDNKSMQEWHYRWVVEALRVAKPGAHMLAFGGDRTHHRLMVAIEDAGWEIRTCLYWVYSQGFPKSLDVSKAIDKAAGVEREVVGLNPNHRPNSPKDNQKGDFNPNSIGNAVITVPTTDAAKQWNGWGTGLKPAVEIITMARKPLSEKTVAENVQKWGTGAINIDACRVESEPELAKNWQRVQSTKQGIASTGLKAVDLRGYTPSGRFPSTLIHDGSEEVVGLFPETKSIKSKRGGARNDGDSVYRGFPQNIEMNYECGFDDSGSAARFFYSAKADSTERRKHLSEKNTHPTVKPVDLMRYLCKLITPPNGIILDPFCGSGSTGVAAFEEGFKYILIDKDPEFSRIAKIRCAGKRLGDFC